MTKRYLSKSRFKLGHECPTKLYYTGKSEYPNSNDEDEFLKALAEGGYQVGELAKLYYPGGTEPNERDYAKAHEITRTLLASDTPSIYEASILHENLFVRVDIINRIGKDSFELIEVKAKSFDPEEENPFWNKIALKKNRKELLAKWEPYLYDVAFQTHVARLAFPSYTFHPFLLLANKGATASVDGLNQLFPVFRSSADSLEVRTKPEAYTKPLGDRVLIKVDVSEAVDFILKESRNGIEGSPFADYAGDLARIYRDDHKYSPEPGSRCKNCEFRSDALNRTPEMRSGFHECWAEAFKVAPEELDQPLVTDLWNFRGSDAFLHSNLFLLRDLPAGAINLKESENEALTSSERQLLQLSRVKEKSEKLYVEKTSLARELDTWTYPLHFIDFETTTTAIPFFSGQRPYESIAFQFSHHEMQRDGSFAHKTQFLSAEPGKFPNFEFVRALRAAVGTTGTILRYSPHENSILNHIHRQLSSSREADRADLLAFIETITKAKTEDGKAIAREGARGMVDLFELLKKYYYDPTTEGSNSLKYVFPAVLARSKHLQEKYAKPIYGAKGGIPSLNFQDKVWVTRSDGGKIENPYRSLPPIHEGRSFDDSERLFSNSELREGGSASVAFGRMMFEEMSAQERTAIRAALFRYCELDTLAMVMLVEHWKNIEE